MEKQGLKMPLKGKVIVRILETPAIQRTKKKMKKESRNRIIVPETAKKSVEDTFAKKVLDDMDKKMIHPFVVQAIASSNDSDIEPGDMCLMSIRKSGRILDDLDSDFPVTADVILVEGERLFVFPEDFIVAVDNSLIVKNGVVTRKK